MHRCILSPAGRLGASRIVLRTGQWFPAPAASDEGPPGCVGVRRHQPRGRSEKQHAGLRPGLVTEK